MFGLAAAPERATAVPSERPRGTSFGPVSFSLPA